MERMMKYDFIEALVSVDKDRIESLIEEHQITEFNTIDSLITFALDEIGKDWDTGKYSLSQIFMAGIICEELISEFLSEEVSNEGLPRIGIGVLQDHHALGKRMVTSVLKASGYTPLDLGTGLTIDMILKAIRVNELDIMILSVLMLNSAFEVEKLMNAIKEEHLKVKVIVGGAPFRMDPELYKTVHADADGKKASDIVKVIKSLWEADNE